MGLNSTQEQGGGAEEIVPGLFLAFSFHDVNVKAYSGPAANRAGMFRLMWRRAQFDWTKGAIRVYRRRD